MPCKSPGRGRPALYPGKSAETLTIRLTPDARAAIDRTAEALSARFGTEVTVSDALEHLVRKGARLGARPTPRRP